MKFYYVEWSDYSVQEIEGENLLINLDGKKTLSMLNLKVLKNLL